MRRVLCITFCAVALNIPARATAVEFFEITVDIDGVQHCGLNEFDSVFVDLPAGDFDLNPIGPDDGGLYTARNPWGRVPVACDESGANCARGWRWDPCFKIASDEPITVACLGNFETPELARSWLRPRRKPRE